MLGIDVAWASNCRAHTDSPKLRPQWGGALAEVDKTEDKNPQNAFGEDHETGIVSETEQ